MARKRSGFSCRNQLPAKPARPGRAAITIQSEFNAKSPRRQDAKRILDCGGRAQRRHRFATTSRVSKAAWLPLCGIPGAIQTFAPLHLCVFALKIFCMDTARQARTPDKFKPGRNPCGGGGIGKARSFLTRIFLARQGWHLCRLRFDSVIKTSRIARGNVQD